MQEMNDKQINKFLVFTMIAGLLFMMYGAYYWGYREARIESDEYHESYMSNNCMCKEPETYYKTPYYNLTTFLEEN